MPRPQSAHPAHGGTTPSSSGAMATLLAPHLFEAAPDALAVVDHHGALILVNGQLETLFGYDRSDLLGQVVELLIPESLRMAHTQHRAHYALAPHARAMGEKLSLFGRRRDGSEFPVEISLSPIEVEDSTLVMAIIRDVTARKQLETALQASVRAAESHLHLLQTVLDQLPSGVFLARGPQARLVLANRAAANLWGATWSADQTMANFISKSGIRFFGPTGQPCPVEQIPTLRALRTGEQIVQAQLRVTRADGISVPVLVTAVPLPASLFTSASATNRGEAAHGQVGAKNAEERMVLVVYQDVTMLEETERVKDEFVTLAAHELRTPIAVASGYAQMLLRVPDETAVPSDASTLDSWQEEALRDIASAMTRLTALTDDLLDVTKLQAGRLQLSREPHDLVALARRICRRMQATTAHHQIHLAVPDEPLVADLDVRRVEQVLHNLLSNAIKYSVDGGPITVTLQAVEGPGPKRQRTRMAEIIVQDHGLGIPADQQPTIFERFSRARNAQEHGIDGTGLGLYLSRELLAAHGGSIWFDSVEGQGSTFHVLLPLLEPAMTD
ncbi:MAG TPA: ATP-binding protein [Ktedonobacterales bacterium]